MEIKQVKKENKFIDNVAYKNKFQFLIWVNDNVICQRYFKINGYNERALYTEEFAMCMKSIVSSIQKDLESKSRIFGWYTNMNEPFKLTGYVTTEDIEKYGVQLLHIMGDSNINGDVEVSEDLIINKSYLDYGENNKSEYVNEVRPEEGECILKFAFLIDDIVVYEHIWDGNVYPKFVRNGVDLTNTYALYNKQDTSAMSFNGAIIRHMQEGKTNLISDFISRICKTLSNNDEHHQPYTHKMTYRNNNTIDSETRNAAVEKYGVIKPTVTGYVDIKEEDKTYTYYSAYEAYKRSWKESVNKKTYKYFKNLY